MNHQRFIPFCALCSMAVLVLSACVPISRPATADVHTAVVHWSYEGEEGPTHWGELKPDWTTCATGTNQSPIDLSLPATEDLTNLVFHYQPSKLNIINNGHTVQVDYDGGSYIELDGVRYDLAQFHFHAPSEHAINGKLADAELHLVHKSAAGALAVVGVLINAGSENAALQSTLSHLPATSGAEQQIDDVVNAADFLPANQETYRYTGSLTTPPCTESVAWNVMVVPIEVSAEQLAAFTTLFDGNNRPLQALDGRTLVEDTTP